MRTLITESRFAKSDERKQRGRCNSIRLAQIFVACNAPFRDSSQRVALPEPFRNPVCIHASAGLTQLSSIRNCCGSVTYVKTVPRTTRSAVCTYIVFRQIGPRFPTISTRPLYSYARRIMSGGDELIHHSWAKQWRRLSIISPHCADNPTWKNNEIAKSACANACETPLRKITTCNCAIKVIIRLIHND